MTQRRIVDYGTPVEAGDLKDVFRSLARQTVLQGFRLGIAAKDKIRVNPGVCVTHEGVVIIEDETIEVTIQNTSAAADYTVLYEHTDMAITGGVPAELKAVNGIIANTDLKGVVLGYIRYPGNAIPLSPAMFLQEPEAILGNYIPSRNNADWIVPIKGNGYMVTDSSGSALTITDDWNSATSKMSLKIRNNINAIALGAATLTFPFKVGSQPYSLIQAKMQIDLGANVDMRIIDASGNVVDITTNPLQPQADFFLYSLSIPREAVQVANDYIYLQLVLNVQSTRGLKVQGLGLSAYNLPV